jgi:hypothetical protein
MVMLCRIKPRPNSVKRSLYEYFNFTAILTQHVITHTITILSQAKMEQKMQKVHLKSRKCKEKLGNKV